MNLILDSSLKGVSLTICDDQKILMNCNDPKAKGESVSQLVKEALMDLSLTPQEIKNILVTTGPGSFTGLRVAMAWASGFSVSSNTNLYTCSTLKWLDMGNDKFESSLQLIPAYNGQWYVGWRESASELSTRMPNEEMLSEQQVLELVPKVDHVQVAFLGREKSELDSYLCESRDATGWLNFIKATVR